MFYKIRQQHANTLKWYKKILRSTAQTVSHSLNFILISVGKQRFYFLVSSIEIILNLFRWKSSLVQAEWNLSNEKSVIVWVKFGKQAELLVQWKFHLVWPTRACYIKDRTRVNSRGTLKKTKCLWRKNSSSDSQSSTINLLKLKIFK